MTILIVMDEGGEDADIHGVKSWDGADFHKVKI